MSDVAGPRWRWHDLLGLAACVAFAHVVFYPVLQAGYFLYGRDTIFHDYPFLQFYWSEILDHARLALWNPYLFCGLPSLGTFASCPFYPLRWLFAIAPFPVAFNYQYILSDALAGGFTYWAARWMGLRRVPALFAGLVFMVGGHLVTLAHAGHLQKFQAIAWLPFVLGCATAAIRSRQFRYWPGAGVGLGAQLLASHPQIAYYTILLAVAWTLWLAVTQPADSRKRLLGYAAGGLAIAMALALALSAAQLLPALELGPHTVRGEGVSFEQAAETSYPPLEFIEYILPGFLGDSAADPPVPYWGRWGERIVTDYMGILPLILLVYGLAAGRDRGRWFWLATILVVGLLAAGKYTPVYRLAYAWLPGLDRFRSPGTIMVLIAWAAALLAGQGLQTFIDRIRNDRRWVLYAVVLIGAAGVAVALAAVLTATRAETSIGEAMGLAGPWRGTTRVASVYAALQRSLVFTAIACAILAAVCVTGHAKEDRARQVAFGGALVALFLLAFVDPRTHESRYIRAEPVQPYHRYLFRHWAVPRLRDLPEPVRGIEIGNEYSNRLLLSRIGSLHGYHPVFLQRYKDLLDLYGPDDPRLGELLYEQFVIAPIGRPPGRSYRRVADETGRVLWFRDPAPPYGRFPASVEVATGTEALLAAMKNSEFDPNRIAYTLDAELQSVPDRVGVSTPIARVMVYQPNRIVLEVETDTPRPIVLAELAAPGWTASMETGERLAIHTADQAFRAMKIPAGQHRVTLQYAPFSFRLGLYLSLGAMSCLIVVFLAFFRR